MTMLRLSLFACLACASLASAADLQKLSVYPADINLASVIGWERYVGAAGASIGMHAFGCSAPLKDLLRKFGFVPEQVLAAAKEQLAAARMERT